MTSLEKQALYSVLLRLTDDNQILTPMERRDIINQIVHAACGMTADDILSSTQNNRKLQIKRGTKSQNDNYTGLPGEITYDSDTQTIRIHNGTLAGGVALATLSDIPNISILEPDYENLTQNPNTAPSEYIATNACLICCKGNALAYDLYKDDTQILVEFIYSANYTSAWAFVPPGYRLVRRETSQYSNFIIVPLQ